VLLMLFSAEHKVNGPHDGKFSRGLSGYALSFRDLPHVAAVVSLTIVVHDRCKRSGANLQFPFELHRKGHRLARLHENRLYLQARNGAVAAAGW
jgi:hypothetical protein